MAETDKLSPHIRSEIEFGINLLRQQNMSESLVFSPISIALGLSLVHSAASGKTRDEITDVILRGSTNEQYEKHFSEVLKTIKTVKPDSWISEHCEINVANHVFGLKGYPIKTTFLEVIKKLYNAGASQLDFGDKKKSAEIMNKFVSNETKGHIDHIISPEDIKEDLVTVFTNAIYFKAKWYQEFQAAHTYKKDFFASKNSKRSIDFLSKFAHTEYSENEKFEMLSMPYRDTSFSMNIFLPKVRFGLNDALMKLTSATILKLLTKTTTEHVMIRIPKWKIEKTLEMNEILKTLGIEKAFDIDNQEFRKLANNTHGITSIAHSATIEVDEEGTTASASTRLLLRGGGAPERIVKFTADHPFLFILTKDVHPLFIGIHY